MSNKKKEKKNLPIGNFEESWIERISVNPKYNFERKEIRTENLRKFQEILHEGSLQILRDVR